MFRVMVTLVLGAILGAVLTLASQLFIQLRVMPRVEARKRREDRWERAVRDFIELLRTSLSLDPPRKWCFVLARRREMCP